MTMLPLLLEPEQLAAHLDDTNLLIVDLCKASVYQQAHIPRAVWLNSRLLMSGELPAAGQLPSLDKLNELFSAIGLTPDKHIVVYDDEGGGWAGRFIWTLDVIGHHNYSYVNGGLHAWLAANLAIENTPNIAQASITQLQLNDSPQADIHYLLAHYQDTDHSIWDSRSPEEFSGERLLAQRGGHIPNAVNYEWTWAMDKNNALKIRDLAIVRAELAQLGITDDKTIVTYCQTHHRSGFSYLLGRILGFNIKAYAGSWSEWGNRADTPIAK